MADDGIQPVDADLDELKADYPEGTIVVLQKENSKIFEDREYRAVVTGHSVVEESKVFTPKRPGPRVCVSGNPPGYERVDGGEFGASMLRPCEIKGTDGRAEPSDD